MTEQELRHASSQSLYGVIELIEGVFKDDSKDLGAGSRSSLTGAPFVSCGTQGVLSMSSTRPMIVFHFSRELYVMG